MGLVSFRMFGTVVALVTGLLFVTGSIWVVGLSWRGSQCYERSYTIGERVTMFSLGHLELRYQPIAEQCQATPTLAPEDHSTPASAENTPDTGVNN